MLAKSLLSPTGFPLGRTLLGGMSSCLAGAGHDCLFLETPERWGGEQGKKRSNLSSSETAQPRSALTCSWIMPVGRVGSGQPHNVAVGLFLSRNPYAGDGLHGCG